MLGYVVIILVLLVSAFLGTMESVFVLLVRRRNDYEQKSRYLGVELIRLFRDRPADFILTIHAGYIISLAVLVSAFALTLFPWFASTTLSVAAIILLVLLFLLLLLLFIVLFPRIILAVSRDFFIHYLSLPGLFFFLLFYPAGKFVAGILKLLMKSKNSGEELNRHILEKISNGYPGKDNAADAGPERQNKQFFRNVLGFSHIRLREIMVPRTEIEAVPVTSSPEYLREKFISTRFSRIMVYQETIDNITGYFEVKDIFKNPGDIKSLIRKLEVVPETMSASMLLRMFVNEKKNIALVVDEFGGTSGMVTIEDLLEEIVGDIEDEHDKSDLVERVLRQDEFIFSGRIEIDYLNEKYHLGLPEGDDYATLAGLVLFRNGSMPGVNEVISIGNITIKVLRVSATRIELVSLKKE